MFARQLRRSVRRPSGWRGPAIRDWIEKNQPPVKRLTSGALAICENTIVCNITVRRSSWAQVRIPLPPPELSGGVKFTAVVLSLAYDNFGDAGAPATIPATVRILRGSGP